MSAPSRAWARIARGLTGIALGLGAALWAGDSWIERTPLPDLTPAVSAEVVDRDGLLLRPYTVADGLWRMAPAPGAVDPLYLAMLTAYEDRRFPTHRGVDPLALIRAAGQALAAGQIVSGGSTLTMQVARLLGRTETRSVGAKLRQIRLALALERRLSKAEILALYTILAPFGGNLEGLRAASLAYFGREPHRLTPAEAALLVALPQAPEARRPDRAPAAARAARDRVLARAVAAGVLAAEEAEAARREPVPEARRPFPLLAAHAADRARARAPGATRHRLTLARDLQAALEALLAERAAGLPAGASAAILVADHRTGEIRASVGSPGLLDRARQGAVDMTAAPRSPGSALKPLIYGLAFEDGIAHPETLIEDRQTAFGRYVPRNFDTGHVGTVSLRRALELSLNIPAVQLLEAVGPARLMQRLRRAGVEARLPPGRAAGLAIGLGGVGVTLADLVQLYAAIARGGAPVALIDRGEATAGTAAAVGPQAAAPVLAPGAAWQVGDVLAGTPPPVGGAQGRLAYKTGTSYGHRDGWAIGFDGAHVIGVWVGRADGGASPGLTGGGAAAPILFAAAERLGPPVPRPGPPGEVLTVGQSRLPPPLRRFGPAGAGAAVEIAFPPDGARVELAADAAAPILALRVRNGRPPFTWLIDGRPVATGAPGRGAEWRPDGPGYVSIAVIDATGAAARAEVLLTPAGG